MPVASTALLDEPWTRRIPPEVLTHQQAADLLDVDVRTLQRWRKLPRRPLKAHPVPGGRRVFYLRHEIISWLHGHRDLPMTSSPRKARQKARG